VDLLPITFAPIIVKVVVEQLREVARCVILLMFTIRRFTVSQLLPRVLQLHQQGQLRMHLVFTIIYVAVDVPEVLEPKAIVQHVVMPLSIIRRSITKEPFQLGYYIGWKSVGAGSFNLSLN
jgi:hypothetical protein